MFTGKISSISAEKGFGFITPTAGGPDLFFHCSVLDAEFSSLQVDQAVQYEVDEAAEKPRAQLVLTGATEPRSQFKNSSAYKNRGAERSEGRRSEGRRSDGRRSDGTGNSKPAGIRPAKAYGFVTKLPRKKPIGFISSEAGGAEYFFEPQDVRGRLAFKDLTVGDYVCFVPQKNPEDPKKPLAKSVMVIPKPLPKQENSLPKHPRARRKKPTWRSQD